jgi:hypothetical protein
MDLSEVYTKGNQKLFRIESLVDEYLDSAGDKAFDVKNALTILSDLLKMIKGKNDFFVEYEKYDKWFQFLNILELGVLLSVSQKKLKAELVVCIYILSYEYREIGLGLKELDIRNETLLGDIEFIFKSVKGNRRSNFIYEFYKSIMSDKLERLRENRRRIEDVRKEVNKNLGGQTSKIKKIESKIDSINKEMLSFNKTRSFTSAYEGLNNVKTSAERKLRVLNIIAYVIIGLIFCLLVFLLLFSLGLTCDLIGVGCYKKIYDGSMKAFFWNQESRVSIVSISMVFVLIYFFRVFNHRINLLEKIIARVELKSAITSFQLGYLDVVEDKSGNINESIRRYEEFLYGEEKNGEDQFPQVTDNISDLLRELKELVKK